MHIKGNLYLIGSQRATLDLKNDNVVVRVGGGSDLLTEYLQTNERHFERILLVYMIQSGDSIQDVVDQLCQGKNLKSSSHKSNSPMARSISP